MFRRVRGKSMAIDQATKELLACSCIGGVARARRVVERVLSRLRVGGLFFMGTAEGRAPGTVPLESLAPGVFRKLPPGGRR